LFRWQIFRSNPKGKQNGSIIPMLRMIHDPGISRHREEFCLVANTPGDAANAAAIRSDSKIAPFMHKLPAY